MIHNELSGYKFLGQTRIKKGKRIQYLEHRGRCYSIRVVWGQPAMPILSTLKEIKKSSVRNILK